uniref:Mediator of RNA polymerase II transcription subunit 11 n=1 Tax=Spongospora subterranea TaxID=70186 RepID=A0A0H5R9J7_9EUKA|eukprot:CRZ10352.1 hypothetical protein [Spongospora subterranea]
MNSDELVVELCSIETELVSALEWAADALDCISDVNSATVRKTAPMFESFVQRVADIRRRLHEMVQTSPKPIDYDGSEMYLSYCDVLHATKITQVVHDQLKDLRQYIDNNTQDLL